MPTSHAEDVSRLLLSALQTREEYARAAVESATADGPTVSANWATYTYEHCLDFEAHLKRRGPPDLRDPGLRKRINVYYATCLVGMPVRPGSENRIPMTEPEWNGYRSYAEAEWDRWQTAHAALTTYLHANWRSQEPIDATAEDVVELDALPQETPPRFPGTYASEAPPRLSAPDTVPSGGGDGGGSAWLLLGALWFWSRRR